MSYRIVTFTTIGSARLACNLLDSARRVGLDDKIRVYCLDAKSRAALDRFVVATDNAADLFDYRPLVTVGDVPEVARWGQREFAALMLAKLSLLMDLSPRDPKGPFEPCLFFDADTVLCDDPSELLEYYASSAEVPGGASGGPPLWMQNGRDNYNPPSAERGEFCMGCFFACRSLHALWQVAFKWLLDRLPTLVEREDFGDFVTDESAVNAALCFLCLTPGTLDPYEFPNGARSWGEVDSAGERRVGGENSNYVKVVHANWTIGIPAKEARLMASGLWTVPADTFREVGL
jgi:hypothetical protein